VDLSSNDAYRQLYPCTRRGRPAMPGMIERFGALGVFLLMVPESACIPVPSEVTLLFSGFAVREGWMSFPLAVIAATSGNLAGSLLAYYLGASRLLDRLPATRAVLGRWEGLLDRHGLRAVFIARLLPLARTFVSLPAGARHVRLVPFIALTIMGCALWAAAFVLVGMVVGAGWAAISSTLGRALLVVGLVVLSWSAIGRRRGRRRRCRARANRLIVISWSQLRVRR
jgi:membrane protein DedA with SNARE-associated domain